MKSSKIMIFYSTKRLEITYEKFQDEDLSHLCPAHLDPQVQRGQLLGRPLVLVVVIAVVSHLRHDCRLWVVQSHMMSTVTVTDLCRQVGGVVGKIILEDLKIQIIKDLCRSLCQIWIWNSGSFQNGPASGLKF